MAVFFNRDFSRHFLSAAALFNNTIRPARPGGLRLCVMPVALCLCLCVSFTTSAAADAPTRCVADGNQWRCESTLVSQSGTGGPVAAHPLYWVPKENVDIEALPDDEKERLEQGCCGVYLPPIIDSTPASAETKPTEITTKAGGKLSGNWNQDITISGGVSVMQGPRRISADTVSVTNEQQTLVAEGGLEILDPSSLLIGASAAVNRETGETTLNDAQFIYFDNRLRGSAGQLHRAEDESLSLIDGSFTQCEPGHEHWLIRGSEITLDTVEQEGTAKHLRLELGGVPVFYFPYVTFPTGDKSKTGLLYPSFSDSDFPIPYFISLAPNYDLTLTPRWIADRGTSLELEFRHLNEWSESSIGGAFMEKGEDVISEAESEAIAAGELTVAEATRFHDKDRWLFSLQQQGGDMQDWYSLIDVAKVSDIDYFRQIDTVNLNVNRNTHLRRLGEVGYNTENWALSARWEEFQALIENIAEPYKQKPRIGANAYYQWGEVSLGLSNEFTQFDYADSDPNKIIGDRFRTDYQLAWNKEWLWGYFTPSVLVKTLSYQLDEARLPSGAEASPSFAAPQAAIDAGLFFERDGSWFGSDYLQTFEPRLFYFYSEFEDQSALTNIGGVASRDVDFDTSELTFSYNQLFRTSRFAGGDRIDDANQVSIGLTSRFYNNQGLERLSVSLGQIYYQDDRQVTLRGTPEVQPESAVAGQIEGQLTDFWRLGGDLLYNPDTQKVDQGNLSLSYYDKQSRIFNIGYRYRRRGPAPITGEDLDDSQSEVSFVWPIAGSWSVIGRSFHDFREQRELDSLFGLEYTSCCYRVRVMGRRWLDNELVNRVDDDLLEYENGIFIEFHLRGLGLNIGNRLNNALKEGIQNYEVREKQFTGR